MTNHLFEAWHQLARSQDLAVLDALLADAVVFVSPVVHAPRHGKAVCKSYLAGALKVLLNPGFCYVREIIGPRDAMLEFETETDGVKVNGVDIIQWNDDGKIVESKVMVRPLKAINLVHERMAAMLVGIQNGP